MAIDVPEDGVVGRLLRLLRIDFSSSGRPPSMLAWTVATVVSIVGSLAADAILVAIGTRVFPSTTGYVHFQFHDYARLTVIGVVVACLAWPVTTQISSSARWLFLRMAVLVSAVLLLPDVYLLVKGQPPRAVVVLMCMHLAIGVITYNALVRIAPPRARRRRRRASSTGT